MAKNGIIIPVSVMGILVIVIGTSLTGAFKYGHLDAAVKETEVRVEKVEIKTEDNEDAVQELASTVKEFVAVQQITNLHLGEMVQELKEAR